MTGSIESLRTTRLRLERVELGHLDDLCRMHRDRRVMATLAGVSTDEETARRMDAWITHWNVEGFGFWTLFDAETGAFVGRGGLRRLRVESEDVIEIAYALMSRYWGRGLATELARESARVGFEVLGLPDLVAFTLPTNRASQRVMEKTGLRYERDIVHAGLPHVLYRISSSDWPRVREAPGGA